MNIFASNSSLLVMSFEMRVLTFVTDLSTCFVSTFTPASSSIAWVIFAATCGS